MYIQLSDYIPNAILQAIVTVLKDITDKVSLKTKITYVKGCNVIGNGLNEINSVRKAAKNVDVAIVVVGENEREAKDGQETNGEGRDMSSLDLKGLQEDLLKEVFKTRTPIVVLINGRLCAKAGLRDHL